MYYVFCIIGGKIQMSIDASKVIEEMEDYQFIFGAIQILANRIQVVADQNMRIMSLKQFMLMIMIAQFKDKAPTLSELAYEMGTSRQNIKQLALKICEKGYLKMIKDPEDARAIRLQAVGEYEDIFRDELEFQDRLLSELYEGVSPEEGKIVSKVLFKRMMNMGEMQERTMKGENKI